MEYFAPWLRRQLQRREWNQADLARRADVSPRTVSAWVRGERLPDPINCDRIADALGIPLDEVLRVAGHRPSEERNPDDETRDRIKALIDGIPIATLATVEPMLRTLYDDAQKTRLRVIEGRRAAEGRGTYGA